MNYEALSQTYALCFPIGRPWTALEFAKTLAQKHALLFGDEKAFGILQVIADQAEVITFATHPNHRRQGLGAQIMAEMIAHCKQRGVTQIILEVAADNTAALNLYKRIGFTETGRRTAYYSRTDGTRCDAILLEKRLSPDSLANDVEDSG